MSLPYGIRHGLLMLRRDRSYGALLATLTGTIFLFQLLCIVMLGVSGAEKSLTAAVDIKVPLLYSASDDQMQTFFAEISRQPFTAQAISITREQAYEAQRQSDPALISLVERAQLGNPFHDTVAIRLASGNNISDFQKFLHDPKWAGVVDPASLSSVEAQATRSEELLSGAHAIGFLSQALIFIALAVIVFILIMSFDARAELRSEEITVARLLGAQPRAVFQPFITEATILLLLASVLSACILGIVIMLLPIVFPAIFVAGSLSVLWSTAMGMVATALPIALLLHVIIAPLLAWAGVKLGMKMAPLSLA